MTLIYLLFIVLPSYADNSVDTECAKWFLHNKIQKNAKDCVLQCASTVADMGTFHCPDQCDSLCKADETTNIPGKLLYYPGLTPAEKKLVEKYPKDAIIVFIQKTKAEVSTNRNFPDQNMNDESDAFRHFMWAGLLTKELTAAKAKEFLDAHENNRLQDISEKDMDDFNNQKGRNASEKLISENKWNSKNLEAEGLKALHDRQLKVLSPGQKIPETPR